MNRIIKIIKIINIINVLNAANECATELITSSFKEVITPTSTKCPMDSEELNELFSEAFYDGIHIGMFVGSLGTIVLLGVLIKFIVGFSEKNKKEGEENKLDDTFLNE